MHRDSPDLNTEVHRKEGKPSVGQLNPDWVEYLMGWPMGWTSLAPLPPEQWEEWLAGDWWESDPSEDERDVPRVTTVRTNRVARLKAIGNGQVPATAAIAWRILSKRED